MRPLIVLLIPLALSACLEPGVRTVYVKVPAWDFEGDPDREDLIARFRLRYPLEESNTTYPSLLVPVPTNATRLKFDVWMVKNATPDMYVNLVRGARHSLVGTDEVGGTPVCYELRGDGGYVVTAGQEDVVFHDQVIKPRPPKAGNLTFRIEGHGQWWVDVQVYSVGINATRDDIDRLDQPPSSARCDG